MIASSAVPDRLPGRRKPLKADEKDGPGGWQRTLSDSAPYLGIGSSLAATVLVCLWLGHLVDRKLGTEPVGILVGAAVGLLSAGLHFYRMYKVMSRKR